MPFAKTCSAFWIPAQGRDDREEKAEMRKKNSNFTVPNQ
jgi:hypothetical protein